MKTLNKQKTYEILQSTQIDNKLIEEIIQAKKYYRILTNADFLNIKENESIIYKLYEEANWPFYKIGMLCNVSDNTAKKYCLNAGVSNKGHARGKNSNNNYFEYIDTQDKAYFLGLIYADGSLVYHDTSYIVSLTLTQSDNYIIQKFLDYAKIDTPIFTVHKEDPKPRSQINIKSKKIFNDLMSLGCLPNKSHAEHLDLPCLSEEFLPHFIRGYFDGDGIAFSDGRLGFCGHLDIITLIKTVLDKVTSTNVNITFNKSNNIYYLVYNRQEEVSKIIDYIYKDKKDLFLERKYIKYRPLL